MNRLVTFPVMLPLRIAALQLRLARASAEMALDMARELAGAAPWAGSDAEGDVRPAAAPPPGAPAAPGDPAEPARAARRSASVQRTTARSSARASTTPARRSPAPKSPPPAPKSPPPAPVAPPPSDAGEAPAAPPSPARPRAGRKAAAPPPAARKRAAASPRRAARQAATPPSEGEGARPRPRRAARKATAAKPARERASEPTRAEVAAVRQANREAAAVEGGPGPAVRLVAPWEGYDEMPLDQVLARLEGADEVLLAAVRLYETQGESRQVILLATEPS
ncbi:MAG: hypothetical protein QOD44_1300 [Solirubrobacteraceae bacterium]|nr:hypothetical protein [Solirubrobacteraceae bacterium]